MKRRKRAARRQATLKGWWKALPFLLLPFGAFLTETWLHTEILTNGYRDWDLRGEIRVLKENIVQLEGDLSGKTNVGTIDQQAKDRGFERPQKGSLRVEVTKEFLEKTSGFDREDVRGSD